MVGRRLGLEDRVGIQRPRQLRIDPPGVRLAQNGPDLLKIILVVGPEEEPGPLPRPAGHGLEKPGLQQPVLVVPGLGPGIGKEHPNFLESDARRQREQELPGLRAQEVAVVQPRPVALLPAARKPLQAEIDANAEPLRKLGRIAHEEMAMATAHFPHNRTRRRQEGHDVGAKRGAAARDDVEELRAEIHAGNSDAGWRQIKPDHVIAAEGRRQARWSAASGRAMRDSFWATRPEVGFHPPAAQARLSWRVALPAGVFRGSRMMMAVPFPVSLSAQTRPPWSWIRCLTMLSPRPVPPVSRERPLSTR